jgi:hypothetical protein
MTIDATRDALGRLPAARLGEWTCRERDPFLGLVCQGRVGHRPPCRHYVDPLRVEWWPRQASDVAGRVRA